MGLFECLILIISLVVPFFINYVFIKIFIKKRKNLTNDDKKIFLKRMYSDFLNRSITIFAYSCLIFISQYFKIDVSLGMYEIRYEKISNFLNIDNSYMTIFFATPIILVFIVSFLLSWSKAKVKKSKVSKTCFLYPFYLISSAAFYMSVMISGRMAIEVVDTFPYNAGFFFEKSLLIYVLQGILLIISSFMDYSSYLIEQEDED